MFVTFKSSVLLLRGLRVALACCLVATCAWAAAPEPWQPYPEQISTHPGGGPWGGSIRRIISDDRNVSRNSLKLWTATRGGVYLSVDGGVTWEAGNGGLQSLDVTDVAVFLDAPSTELMAATDGVALMSKALSGSCFTIAFDISPPPTHAAQRDVAGRRTQRGRAAR